MEKRSLSLASPSGGELGRGKDSPAGYIVSERIRKMIQEDEPDRYPNGVSFIAADYPDFEAILKRCLRDGSPIAVVFPDGGEIVATPAGNALVRALRRALARLDRRSNGVVPPGLASIQLPADYVVEVRERVSSQ